MQNKTRNIYISYNHTDQYFKDKLNKIIGEKYHITSSPQEYSIKNNINKYFEQLENENEDIVIILIGTDTYKSKSVDWEIEYGLNHDSCIIGLCLPTNDDYRKKTVNPDKCQTNWSTTYTQDMHHTLTGRIALMNWKDTSTSHITKK